MKIQCMGCRKIFSSNKITLLTDVWGRTYVAFCDTCSKKEFVKWGVEK